MANDVIEYKDGVTFYKECTSNTLERNSIFNGYHREIMVNNILAYGANGTDSLCAGLLG